MNGSINLRGGVKLGEGLPKICIPLSGKTTKDLVDEIGEVKATKADLVEWRVDCFDDVADLAAVKAALTEVRAALGDMPLLFTFRTQNEGGTRPFSKEAYLSLNNEIAKTGAVDLIDIEVFTGDEAVQALVKTAQAAGVRVVTSNHDFDKTPDREEIIKRLTKMKALGADVPKIALMPQSVADVLTLLDASHTFHEQNTDCPIITMSMGALGVVSRIAGNISGTSLTFASLRKASAPGQVAVVDLAAMLPIVNGAV